MLLDSEKTDLRMQITIFAAVKIKARIDGKDKDGKVWKQVEISRATNVLKNRITETLNWEKYQKPLSETDISKLIIGGLFTMDELKRNLDLSEDAELYIKRWSKFDDKTLMDTIDQKNDEGFSFDEIIEHLKKLKR